VPAQDGVDGATKQLGDVGADLTHLEGGLLHHREHTARLNAARDMDRLAGAVVEVDGCAHRDEVVDLLALPCESGVVLLGVGYAIGSAGSVTRDVLKISSSTSVSPKPSFSY
jgi:hypothetical protein